MEINNIFTEMNGYRVIIYDIEGNNEIESFLYDNLEKAKTIAKFVKDKTEYSLIFRCKLVKVVLYFKNSQLSFMSEEENMEIE